MDRSRLIGSSGGLPWHLPEDMARMKQLTMGHILVMGRNTYFSLPEKYRPLPWRRNIVITRTAIEWVETYASIDEFLDSMSREWVKQCFLFGGAQLYNAFFSRGLVDRVECTLVDGHHEGDIFVDEWRDQYEIVGKKGFSRGVFLSYRSQKDLQKERDLYDQWNMQKKKFLTSCVHQSIKGWEIWYTSFGYNVGSEMYGKKNFSRPVLVLKRVGSLYLILPLTTHGRDDSFHHTISSAVYDPHHTQPSISRANILQIRSLDERRFQEYVGRISQDEFSEIRKKITKVLL